MAIPHLNHLDFCVGFRCPALPDLQVSIIEGLMLQTLNLMPLVERIVWLSDRHSVSSTLRLS
jgi:hypothetical protein